MAERRARPAIWRDVEGDLSISLTIDAVAPLRIQEGETFKVTWTLTVGDAMDSRSVTVVLLTDDARLVLADPKTQESPPELPVQIAPGMKATKTMTVVIYKRKGLIDDPNREATGSPFFVLGRVRHDSDVLASSPGVEIEIAGLPRRQVSRIFT